MKIAVTTQIMDAMTGQPLTQPSMKFDGQKYVANGSEIVTVRAVMIQSLNYVVPEGREPITPDQAYKRGKLIEKIRNEDNPDLQVEEAAIVKELVAKVYPPSTVSQIHDLLESKKKP